MPFRNGTGPQGRGPLTGWGMGNCRREDLNERIDPKIPANQTGPDFTDRLHRRGFGPRFFRGRGFRFRRWW